MPGGVRVLVQAERVGIKPLRPGDAVPPEAAEQLLVRLQTTKNSALGVGYYPVFKYNASKGGGPSTVTVMQPNRIHITFDPDGLYIPSVTWRTARLLGAPLPPIFAIDILPTKLEGTIETDTGKVELQFSADFMFKAASVYKAPPMHVDTLLTTEAVQSIHHNRQGKRLDQNGDAVLVGVGEVSPTGHRLLDSFLRLPTDVLGQMSSKFTWENKEQLAK